MLPVLLPPEVTFEIPSCTMFPAFCNPLVIDLLAFWSALPACSRGPEVLFLLPLLSLLLLSLSLSLDVVCAAAITGAVARLTMAKPTSVASTRYFAFVESIVRS